MKEGSDLWRQFENSTTSIALKARRIDGDIGQQLHQIRNQVFELGNALYKNYTGSWEVRTFGNSILLQQIVAIEACKELQKSIGFLTYIQLFKRNQHLANIRKRKFQETTKGEAVVAADMVLNAKKLRHSIEETLESTGDSAPTLPLFDNGAPIKEEPIDIKEEPIVHVGEIKQEDPLADVFCPSTGKSRPIDAMNRHDTTSGMDKPASNPEVVKAKTIFAVRKLATRDKSEAMKINGEHHQVMSLEQKSFGRRIVPDVTRKCYLCGACTNISYRVPINPSERSAFLDKLDENYKHRLEDLRNSSDQAFICFSHLTQRRKLHLKKTHWTEPKYFRPREQTRFMEYSEELITSDCRAKPGEAREVPSVAFMSMQCDLCDVTTDDYVTTPSNPILRDDLLNRVRQDTQKDSNRMTLLRLVERRLFFCTKHIQVGSTEDVKRQEKAKGKTRRCYLCGKRTSSWMVTPHFPLNEPSFFQNLVELNKYQLMLVKGLINCNARANICTEHCRYPESPNASGEKRSRTEPASLLLHHSDYCNANEEPFGEPGPSRTR